RPRAGAHARGSALGAGVGARRGGRRARRRGAMAPLRAARRHVAQDAVRARLTGQGAGAPPWSFARSSALTTLPIALRGRSSTKNTRLGTLKLAISAFSAPMIALSVSAWPGFV